MVGRNGHKRDGYQGSGTGNAYAEGQGEGTTGVTLLLHAISGREPTGTTGVTGIDQ